MKIKRIAAILLTLCITLTSFVTAASALSWDGSSSGGGGTGTPGGANGYAVRYTNNNTNCIAYRFSLVNKSGALKVSKVIDVFRNTTSGNAAISNNNVFTVKRNKGQLIGLQNGSFGTSKTTANCYREANMGFATALPAPSSMGTWQNNVTNLNAVLSALGAGDLSDLVHGDKIIVEPLWDVRLRSVYHSLTVTEIALYGKHILGANSDGGTSRTAQSWGFISRFTNREYPNALFTPDGQGLWTGVRAIGSSSRATFTNLINRGYGVGIAYNETKPEFTPVLAVDYCLAVKGGRTSGTVFGKSTGNSFSNWTYQTAYPIMGDTISFQVKFKPETQTARVTQSMRVDGGSWNTWTGNMTSTESTQWHRVQFSSSAIAAGKSHYTIDAKIDHVDSRNRVLKAGTVKTFYIPVRPRINRTQTAKYDITNTRVARNGPSVTNTGRVYVGQKVYPKYTFTSSSSWTSTNNFSSTINGSNDISFSANINSGSSIERNSTKSPYVVPNVTSLPHILTTSWASDPGRTTERTTINITVVRADVELKEIRLIDGTTGAYVTGNKLWVHQKVTPQFVYKNNTNIRVFVEGYDNDHSRVGGSNAVYAIPANSEIAVNGKQITIGHVTSQSIWGGVYLDGAGRGGTSWESNRNNNARTNTYTVEYPLKIQNVTLNAPYREGSEVMTSYIVQNQAHFHFTPPYNISVRFTALNGGTSLHTATKSAVVIPANGENLVYYKWTVPSGLNGANLSLRGEIIDGGRVVGTRTFTNGSERRPVSQTPDTVFEKSAPPGFSVAAPPARASVSTAQWSEWAFEGNTFVRRTYGLDLNTGSVPVIVPDVNSPSREQKNGTWHMASGYGFTANWNIGLQTMSGTTAPAAAMFTNAQLAMMYYPEFKYGTATSNYRVLDRTATNTFQLPTNPNAKNSARLHFVPLWFPNTNYRVQGYVGDIWTPAGMLSGHMNSAPVVISQSAYDDWVIGY
jgi:hypothetical protein